jgi:accessory gene regulator protein AgrB
MIYKIGLGLAIALLICLFPMPYGYYTLIRFASMIILGCMAFEFHKEGKIPLCIIAGSLALLFQPFVKITLDKITWNVIDVLVAIALILLWYKNKEQQ